VIWSIDLNFVCVSECVSISSGEEKFISTLKSKFESGKTRNIYPRDNYKIQQDFIDNTQTHKCVTWGHSIYTVLHGETIIYYQNH
jgi:hypothetical protein